MELDTGRLWDALREVIDPELGVNIVDLGLVYEVNAFPSGDVQIVMTLTTPACPLSAYFKRAIPLILSRKVKEIGTVSVDIVWEPRWEPQMMSQSARKMLGWAR